MTIYRLDHAKARKAVPPAWRYGLEDLPAYGPAKRSVRLTTKLSSSKSGCSRSRETSGSHGKPRILTNSATKRCGLCPGLGTTEAGKPMRRESTNTTIAYYVGPDADDPAEELWAA